MISVGGAGSLEQGAILWLVVSAGIAYLNVLYENPRWSRFVLRRVETYRGTYEQRVWLTNEMIENLETRRDIAVKICWCSSFDLRSYTISFCSFHSDITWFHQWTTPQHRMHLPVILHYSGWCCISRKQPFKSKDLCKTLRQHLLHQSLYCGLSVIDSGINGYDFPKECKYYVAAAVNSETSKKTTSVMSTEPLWDNTLYLWVRPTMQLIKWLKNA